jgi:hypothetical protein
MKLHLHHFKLSKEHVNGRRNNNDIERSDKVYIRILVGQ